MGAPGDNGCQVTLGPAPDAVRYVRADLYDAALVFLLGWRGWKWCQRPITRDSGDYHV
jgi:hypothetical protein